MIFDTILTPQIRKFIDSRSRPNIYFTHIPKTGGRSLQSFLSDQYRSKNYCPLAWHDYCLLPPQELRKFKLFVGHPLPKLKEFGLDDFKTVVFLREPVQRTISSLRHMMRDPTFQGHDDVKGRTLAQLVYDDKIMMRLSNTQCGYLSFDVPLSEITWNIKKARAKDRLFHLNEMSWEISLEKARHGLAQYDFVGLQEHYDASLHALCEQFNFSPPAQVPRLNMAEANGEANALSERDIEHMKSYLPNELALYQEVAARWNTSSDAARRAS